MPTYEVTYGEDNRPKLHRLGCADVQKYNARGANHEAWRVVADDLRAAMWQAGEEQRQSNNDPNDMDEDPGVDIMRCAR